MMRLNRCPGGLAAALLIVMPGLCAAPLDRGQVAADAKWVIHLDADAARPTQLGKAFLQELDRKTVRAKEDLQRELGFDLDWTKIASITLYGPSYEKNDPKIVVLVKTALGVRQGLDTALEKHTSNIRVEKSELAGAPLYHLNGELYVAALPGGMHILSKSREAVVKAQAVLAGKSPRLAGGAALSGYGPATGFLMGVAEGFSEQANLPPNAALLRQAEGGQLAVTERGERLHATLAVRARTADVARQMQQIVQGLIALGTMNPDANADVLALAQSASVALTDRLVSLSASVPVTTAIERIRKNR